MITRKKIKMRNIVFLTIISICVFEAIFLPIIVDGQMNSGEIEFKTESINDLKVRSILLYKKGIFNEFSDVHRFQVKLKQDVEYIARIKITAENGGLFFISLYGVVTFSNYNEDISTPITNQIFEIKYTADGTTTGELQVTYILLTSPQFPTYTLYFNKSGFAGWWWIALSGIGVLAVLIFMFTFMTIGLITVSKRKKKKRRKK